jgi:hypothetical protein
MEEAKHDIDSDDDGFDDFEDSKPQTQSEDQIKKEEEK